MEMGSTGSQIPGAVSSLRRCANSISPSPTPPFPRSDQFSLTPSPRLSSSHPNTQVSPHIPHRNPLRSPPFSAQSLSL
ncbi:hypothetical protein GYMLUDRAFT_46868, partial [Collybiopsis luxurians FD-317 M1]